MNIRAKSIKIIFDNSSEDNWEATCGSGIEFDDAMRMIARAWKEYDEPKEPIEPLIKDKGIRKAVRAWAEANGIERVWHEYSSNWLRGNGLKIELENGVEELEQGNYSVDELCGVSKEDEDEA